jgi:hypothetical protein
MEKKTLTQVLIVVAVLGVFAVTNFFRFTVTPLSPHAYTKLDRWTGKVCNAVDGHCE